MKTVRELLVEHFDLKGKDCSEKELASLLMYETESSRTIGETDNHRWYSVTPKVTKLCDVFVTFYEICADGDNDWYDCVMPSDVLNDAKIVEERTRIVEEKYYVVKDSEC